MLVIASDTHKPCTTDQSLTKTANVNILRQSHNVSRTCSDTKCTFLIHISVTFSYKTGNISAWLSKNSFLNSHFNINCDFKEKICGKLQGVQICTPHFIQEVWTTNIGCTNLWTLKMRCTNLYTSSALGVYKFVQPVSNWWNCINLMHFRMSKFIWLG